MRISSYSLCFVISCFCSERSGKTFKLEMTVFAKKFFDLLRFLIGKLSFDKTHRRYILASN